MKKPLTFLRFLKWLFLSFLALFVIVFIIAIIDIENDEKQISDTAKNNATQTSSSNPYANIKPLLEQAQNEELKQVIQEMGDLWWLSKKRENRTDGRTDDVAYFSTTFTDAKYALFKKIDVLETTESTDIKQILMNMNDIVWQWWQASGNDTEETKDMSLKMDAYFPQYLHAQ